MDWMSLIPIAAPIVTGILDNNATNTAIDAQTGAVNQANQLANKAYEQGRSDLGPYRSVGTSSLEQLSGMLQPGGSLTGPSNVQLDPGYQFGLSEGLKGIERSAAARTGTLNGGAVKAANDYAQNYATKGYGDAWNRQMSEQNALFNRLQTLAGMGQNATGMTTNLGMNTANQVGQNTIGLGNAQGAAAINQGNNWGSMIGDIAGGISDYTALQQLQNMYAQPQQTATDVWNSYGILPPNSQNTFSYDPNFVGPQLP